jgi:glycosyltransferase involved in cell wall biosynthesis
MKKTIVHFIHDLGRGGAEMMLVKVIKELKDYNNIVVTLSPKNHFENELQCDKYYCLNLRSILFFPIAVLQLKKIIRENKVDIVHTHLFWPTFIARLSTPKKIPLITTIHAFISNSVEYRKKYMRILDKLTYVLRKNVIIAVAKGALSEYFSVLKLTPYKAYSLYTFVDPNEICSINEDSETRSNDKVRVVAVGALRTQKNHKYLLEAFKRLKDENILLDIYGEGSLQQELQKVISENGLNINLKG